MSGASARIEPRLMVLTDTGVAPEGILEERIEALLAAAEPRSVLVQLRDTTLPLRRRRALGERLSAMCRRYEQWFSVNDRVDLAFVLGADGIHLGERSIAPADARAVLPGAFVSHACHALDALDAPGSDAALLSPILAPRKGRPPLGLEGLARARAELDARRSPTLLYALGGVDASTAAACVANGATGVAVIGAAFDGRGTTPLLVALGIARSA